MKRLLAASLTGLALLSGSALAADLPPAPQVYKAPAVVAPAYNWSGCYSTPAAATACGTPTPNSSLPGGACLTCVVADIRRLVVVSARLAADCDYQVGVLAWALGNPMIVVGLMADYNFMKASKARLQDSLVGASVRSKRPHAWAGRRPHRLWLRAELLAYIERRLRPAPASAVQASIRPLPAPRRRVSAAHTKTGWFLGGGTEYVAGSGCCRSRLVPAQRISATPTSTRRLFRSVARRRNRPSHAAGIRWCRRSARRSSIDSTGNKRRGTLGTGEVGGQWPGTKVPGFFLARVE